MSFKLTGEVDKNTTLQDVIDFLMELQECGNEGVNLTLAGSAESHFVPRFHFGVDYGGLNITVETEDN